MISFSMASSRASCSTSCISRLRTRSSPRCSPIRPSLLGLSRGRSAALSSVISAIGSTARACLVLTLMIMGVATFLIGLVPTYAQIGLWASISLLCLRILLGIGLGGECGGAVLMTYEYAPPEKRGLYASFPQIGLSIGLCLASGVVALLSYSLTNEQFLAWGWRLAFVLSFVFVLIGLYIRLNIMETPEFAKLKESRAEVKVPFASMISDYPKEIVAGMGARYIDGVFFNIFGVYSISYLTQQLKVP